MRPCFIEQIDQVRPIDEAASASAADTEDAADHSHVVRQDGLADRLVVAGNPKVDRDLLQGTAASEAGSTDEAGGIGKCHQPSAISS